jgi:retron-type reverse transcriptase
VKRVLPVPRRQQIIFIFPSCDGFYFTALIHPPSIFPISLNFSESEIYSLLSSDFISQPNCKKNLSKLAHKYEDIISLENILEAWQEFLKGKRNKPDVQKFSFHLMDNILNLHYELLNHTYKHGAYQCFKIADPKPRIIHKATVKDRLLHHAVYKMLYLYFDKKFIADSYSCRNNKGIHRALNQFRKYCYAVSKNNTRQCWILKCDIKKFFTSIDQKILIRILEKYILDKNIIDLLSEIVFSFDKGLPLGNLTSQLFSNVYLNEFDQFVKHKLKIKYYIRYADDFVVFSQEKKYLKDLVLPFQDFLEQQLRLTMHQDKIFIATIYSGVDYLGWVNFKDHRVLRRVTKRKMLKKACNKNLQSYLGMLKHGNTGKLRSILIN